MAKAHIKKLMAIAAAFAAVLIFYFSSTSVGGAVNASAASSYSNVLDDLRKDPNFTILKYPAGGNKYKLDVIQIAESTDKELLIYVYQPYGKITASSISVSKTIGASYEPKKYPLTLQSSDGVFYKYRADGFELEPDALRYYNISQIWRKYDHQIDPQPTDGQTTNEIGYKVAKLLTAATVNGSVTYTLKETQTVEIENPYVGFVRYPSGTGWTSTKSCDGHFVTFDTDWDITRLMAATVTYKTRSYASSIVGGTEYGELSPAQYKTVSSDETAGNKLNGLFGEQYTWSRISRSEKFVNDIKLKDGTEKDELLKRTWVLNFLETEYTTPLGGDNVLSAVLGGVAGTIYNGFELLFSENKGTLVKEVAILRLEFEVNGVPYNLGTVANVVTGSSNPIEEKPNKVQQAIDKILAALGKVPWWGWVLIVLAVVALVVWILSFFFPALKVVLQIMLKGLLSVFKVLWRVICLPFRGIAALANGIQARSKSRPKPQPKHKQARKSRHKRTGKCRGKKRG